MPDLLTRGQVDALVESEALRVRVHLALHRLWTQAVGTDGYEKRLWLDLEAAQDALVKFAREVIEHPRA